MKIIKQISKSEIEKLLSEGVIRNTRRGYVDRNGEQIGYYRTKGVARKRYIEDKYVKWVLPMKIELNIKVFT